MKKYVFIIVIVLITSIVKAQEARGKLTLLNPENSMVIFIDHQPQMAFGITSINRQLLLNNTVALAKTAKVFNVPVIFTSVETKSFSGYIWPQLLAIFPNKKPIERTTMNSWEDKNFLKEIKRNELNSSYHKRKSWLWQRFGQKYVLFFLFLMP